MLYLLKVLYFVDFISDSKNYTFTGIMVRVKCNIFIKLTETVKYNKR